MTKKKYKCPVCGYDKLEEPPEEQTFEICPNCGVEFGYHDAVEDPRELPKSWEALSKIIKPINISKFTDSELIEDIMNLPDDEITSIFENYGIDFTRKSLYSIKEKMELAKKAVGGINRYTLIKLLGLERKHQNDK